MRIRKATVACPESIDTRENRLAGVTDFDNREQKGRATAALPFLLVRDAWHVAPNGQRNAS